MNIQEYISSGILESYALGLTTPQETAEVERLAKLQPEIKAEIEAIHAALEEYAFANAQTPPQGLKEKIWAKIQEEEKLANNYISSKQSQPFTQISRGGGGPNFSPMRVAASILLLASLAGNIYLFNRWKNTKADLTLALSQNATIAQEAKYSKASNLAMNQEMEMMADPANKLIRLAGQKVAPTSKMLLAWNQNDKKVYLLKSQLPAAPSGKQYQLWAIVDKKPVDLGVFDQKNEVLAMKSIINPQAFAVTLEKEGGSPVPTSELYVMGGAE